MKTFGVMLIIAAVLVGMGVWGINYGGGGNPPDGNGGNNGNGIQSYTFTIDTTDGGAVALNTSTLPGEATFIFGAGTVVSLKAVPGSGYQFVKWSGDVGTVDDVYSSVISVTVNGNYSIMARFEMPAPVRYSLAILSTPGGSVNSPGRGTHVYDAGTVVNLVAAPASGYQFAGWTGSVGTIADVKATSTTITMNGNYYICANFREHRTCG
jgi:uncharacterized repeat protein (TIGR02543 family)